MRIALWQQFSSNHSARFTVVGKFDSVNATEDGARELRSVLQAISNWHKVENQNEESEVKQPNPFPADVAENYSITPDQTRLWLSGEYHLQVMGQHLILQSPHTRTKPDALMKVMQKISGQAITEYWDDDPNPHIRVQLTCQTLDEASAQVLYANMDNYMRNVRGKLPPWFEKDQRTWSLKGTAGMDGTSLTFVIWFHDLIDTLPLMIAYLESKGCHHIQFTFSQIAGSPY
jgi:hypothetical protein